MGVVLDIPQEAKDLTSMLLRLAENCTSNLTVQEYVFTRVEEILGIGIDYADGDADAFGLKVSFWWFTWHFMLKHRTNQWTVWIGVNKQDWTKDKSVATFVTIFCDYQLLYSSKSGDHERLTARDFEYVQVCSPLICWRSTSTSHRIRKISLKISFNTNLNLTSHHITSHRITLHNIKSHQVTSNHMTS